MGKRSEIMLFYPFEERRLLKWKPPYIIQPKLDGERCRAVFDKGLGWILLSSELNLFESVPHINQSLLFSDLPQDKEFDGELYVHNSAFEDIHSIVSRRVNIHPDYQSVKFHIFDIVNNLPQWERLRDLRMLSERFRPEIQLVEMYVAESLEGVLKVYDDILSKGYEGIIVRHTDAPYLRRRSTFGMKFKPKKSDEYKIVGFKQMVDKDGNPKEMLGALICQAQDSDEEFSVGSGMIDSFRKKYWPRERAETLVGDYLLVEYQHTSSGRGVPRFPIFKSIISREGPEEVVSPFI